MGNVNAPTSSPHSGSSDGFDLNRLRVGAVFSNSHDIQWLSAHYHHTLDGSNGAAGRVIKSEVRRLVMGCKLEVDSIQATKKENVIAKKHWINMGQDPQAYNPMLPPHLCKGVIKAKWDKQYFKNTGILRFVIVAIHVHTCDLRAPDPRQGSYRCSYSPSMLASAVGTVSIKRPTLNARQLQAVACDKLGLHLDEVNPRSAYHMKNIVDRNKHGTKADVFMTSFARMKRLVNIDKDAVIVMFFYADTIKASEVPDLSNSTRGKHVMYPPTPKRVKYVTPASATNDELVFVLRLHAIVAIPGSTIRRRRATDKGQYSPRLMHSTDFAHCSGPDRGSMGHLSSFAPDDEFMLDIVGSFAENENQNSCSQLYEVYQRHIGFTEEEGINGDRLKGQKKTLDHHCPGTRKDNCYFHLKDNMRLHGATTEDLLNFDDLAYERDPTVGFDVARDNLFAGASPSLQVYMTASLFNDVDCGPAHWSRAMNPGETEGVKTSQHSETYNNTTGGKDPEKPRSLYSPLRIERLLLDNHDSLLSLQDKYSKLLTKNQPIPPKKLLTLHLRDTNSNRFTIQSLGRLIAKVRTNGRYEGSHTHEVHIIDLTNDVFTCSLRCLEMEGFLCEHGIAYINHLGLSPLSFVPDKYLTTSGFTAATVSVFGIEKNLPASLSELDPPSVPIVPPHSFCAPGRRKRVRYKKHQRDVNRLTAQYEKAAQHAVDYCLPAPEMSPSLQILRQKLCKECGQRGHHGSSCKNPTNGRGELMTSMNQKILLEEPCLGIQISADTLLPTSYREFHDMCSNSMYSTKTFARMVNEPGIEDINIEDLYPTDEDEDSIDAHDADDDLLSLKIHDDEDSITSTNYPSDDTPHHGYDLNNITSNALPPLPPVKVHNPYKVGSTASYVNELEKVNRPPTSISASSSLASPPPTSRVMNTSSSTPSSQGMRTRAVISAAVTTSTASGLSSDRSLSETATLIDFSNAGLPTKYKISDRKKGTYSYALLCDHCHSGNNNPPNKKGFIEGIRPAKVVTDLVFRKEGSLSPPTFDQIRNDPETWLDTEAIETMAVLLGHRGCLDGRHNDPEVYVASCLSSTSDSHISPTSLTLPDSVTRLIGIAHALSHYSGYEILLEYRIIIVFDGLSSSINQWKGPISHTLCKYDIDKQPIFSPIIITPDSSVVKVTSTPPATWFFMRFDSFNLLMDDIAKGRPRTAALCDTIPNQSSLLSLIPRPTVHQVDTNTCGPIAVKVLKILLRLKRTRRTQMSVGGSQNDMITIREEVADDYCTLFDAALSRKHLTRHYMCTNFETDVIDDSE